MEPALSPAKVLVIEDDQDLNTLIKFNIENTCKDLKAVSHFVGAGAFERAVEENPDLIVLDLMLPGMYGTEVLKLIRQDARTKDIPVILLTARAQEEDRIAGLEAGADDYVTKPFSPKELVLRIRGLLRRSQKWRDTQNTQTQKRVIQVGSLQIFPDAHRVAVGSETIALTLTEYQLLLFLAEHVGRLQSRDILLQEVWGYEGNVNTRTVDTHIKRLRQKLGNAGSLIETVHGVGYRLNEK